MRTVGCMATYDKRASIRQQTIDSIQSQLDVLYVIDNSMYEIDRKDNAKFLMLNRELEPCIMFLLDDDIEYPPDYVEVSKQALLETGGIITYHGRQLAEKWAEYFKGHRFRYSCFNTVHDNVIVDVPGTGVTAFRTDYFHPIGLADSPDKGMADLIFGLEAAKQGKQITLIKHEEGWLKSIHSDETLYQTERQKGGQRQRELAAEIFQLNHE